jgi:hypothetical protein
MGKKQQAAKPERVQVEPSVPKPKRRRQQKGMCLADRPVLESNAAGIDVGAQEMFVAAPPGRDESPIRVFTTFTDDLERLADWPLWDPCSIRGRPRSRPPSKRRVVQESPDPSQGGSRSSPPSGRARDRRQRAVPRTNSRYRRCG